MTGVTRTWNSARPRGECACGCIGYGEDRRCSGEIGEYRIFTIFQRNFIISRVQSANLVPHDARVREEVERWRSLAGYRLRVMVF